MMFPLSFFFSWSPMFYRVVDDHRAPLQLDLHLLWPPRIEQELPAPSFSSKSTIINGSSSWPARRQQTRGPLQPALLSTNFNSPGHHLQAKTLLITAIVHQPLPTPAGCQNHLTVSWITLMVSTFLKRDFRFYTWGIHRYFGCWF